MADLWDGLSAGMQDALILIAILAPGLVLGAVICRGLALRVLLESLLRRYLWTNIAYILLVALSVFVFDGPTRLLALARLADVDVDEVTFAMGDGAWVALVALVAAYVAVIVAPFGLKIRRVEPVAPIAPVAPQQPAAWAVQQQRPVGPVGPGGPGATW